MGHLMGVFHRPSSPGCFFPGLVDIVGCPNVFPPPASCWISDSKQKTRTHSKLWPHADMLHPLVEMLLHHLFGLLLNKALAEAQAALLNVCGT